MKRAIFAGLLLATACGAGSAASWGPADAHSVTAIVRDMAVLDRYCGVADAGVCTPQFVGAMVQPIECSAAATLHRHRADYDGGLPIPCGP